VSFAVPDGAAFVPQLFARLDVGIRSVTVTRPSLDDVFLAHTGTTLRDAESGPGLSPFALAAGRR
jgi:ABC-2 type transport system ATP-binding protein